MHLSLFKLMGLLTQNLRFPECRASTVLNILYHRNTKRGWTDQRQEELEKLQKHTEERDGF